MVTRRFSIRAVALLTLTGSFLVLQPSTSPANDATVTIRGTYEVLAAVGRTEEHELRALRTDRGTYWLNLGVLRPPRSGATVEVTGRQTSRSRIAVTALTVLTSSRTAAVTPRTSKVLVMRAYWGANRPAKPNTQQARSIWLTKGNAWFREVSHRRYSISGAVTPWLKIKKPARCIEGAFTSMARARVQAKARGYRLGRYTRFILYLPCSERGIVGLGTMPGAEVWQFGSLAYDVALHEEGHNLGLGHANTRECTRGSAQVTWSRTCRVNEYADRFDVMGNRGDGHFQAFSKARLGWLPRTSRLARSGTRTLRPFETNGSGFKAIKVRVSRDKSYWMEYRTRSGVDALLPAGSFGVQIRVRSRSGSGEPELLDAMPGSGSGLVGGVSVTEWDRVRLLSGSSWTSPEGVRFTVQSQISNAAKVSVRFNAGSPGIPSAPSVVTATAVAGGARVSWSRPPDNGSIITRYVVSATPGGATRTARTVGGLITRTAFSGLDPDTQYTFRVQAFNSVGASTATLSNAVTPSATPLSVRVTAPAAGTVVSDVTTVAALPSPGTTKSPIASVDFFAGDAPISTAVEAPWRIDWDPAEIPDGSVTLTAVATDDDGERATSPGVAVTVAKP